MFSFCVDTVEGSISAEREISLFSEKKSASMAAMEMRLFGTFLFMSVILSLDMDVTFCNFLRAILFSHVIDIFLWLLYTVSNGGARRTVPAMRNVTIRGVTGSTQEKWKFRRDETPS